MWSLQWWSLIGLLRNAVDENGTPRCLGSWKMQCTWLRVRGRPRGAPNCMDGVRVGSMGWSLASPYPFLGATILRSPSYLFVYVLAMSMAIQTAFFSLPLRFGTLDRQCDGL